MKKQIPTNKQSPAAPEDAGMKIVYRRLDTIKALPRNAKKHNHESIAASVRDFGFIDVIGSNPLTLHNLDGNGRLESLKMMYAAGEPPPKNIVTKQEEVDGQLVTVWYVPTVDLEFDRETEGIVAMRLNREHDLGGYDDRAVFAVLEQAQAFDRLEQTGFDATIFEALAIKYAPPPEFHTPPGFGLSQENGNGEDNQQQGARLTTGEEQSRQPTQPLQPSYVRMVQLFMNADTQPVFLERCARLVQANRFTRDDGNLVDNLTDLIYALVRDADRSTEPS